MTKSYVAIRRTGCLRQVAIHEAGHVVVCLALGMRVSSVSVTMTKGRIKYEHEVSLADCPVAPSPIPGQVLVTLDDDTLSQIRDELRVDVAGFVAEGMAITRGDLHESMGLDPVCRVSSFMGWSCSSLEAFEEAKQLLTTDLWGSDYCTADMAALFLALPAPDDPVPPLDRIREQVHAAERTAEEILDRNWSAVTRLADSLCRRRSHRMTGRQVQRLIGHLVRPLQREPQTSQAEVES